MWFKSTGKIVYDPYRGNMKNKKHWWCVVEVDKQITRYYRWWITRQYHIHNLCDPSWDAHVSIIRGEKPIPRLMQLWGRFQHDIVEFEYQHNPQKSGNFWFVEVRCPQLTNIRKQFNLPHDWPLHLTVGRTW